MLDFDKLAGNLDRIRQSVECGKLPLSEAMLCTLCFLRGVLDEDRLVWINRELLGFVDSEVAAYIMQTVEANSSQLDYRKNGSSLPSYRVLPGLWVSLSGPANDSNFGISSAEGGVYCCSQGLIELESLLFPPDSEERYFVTLERDPEKRYAFIAKMSATLELYENICRRFLNFLTEVTIELKVNSKIQ